MGKVRVAGFSVSIDGFGAGPEQSLEHPLGKRGLELHGWFFPTQAIRSMIGEEGGTDDPFARAAMEGFGAFILGRNMFGPIRGEWPDDAWKGWWGDNPPYHAPTFILTHHARARRSRMEGGTTFHSVTDVDRVGARPGDAAAGDLNVKIGGGVSTVRQYLPQERSTKLHLALSPVAPGRRGEALFAGIDLPGLGYRVTQAVRTMQATHTLT